MADQYHTLNADLAEALNNALDYAGTRLDDLSKVDVGPEALAIMERIIAIRSAIEAAFGQQNLPAPEQAGEPAEEHAVLFHHLDGLLASAIADAVEAQDSLPNPDVGQDAILVLDRILDLHGKIKLAEQWAEEYRSALAAAETATEFSRSLIANIRNSTHNVTYIHGVLDRLISGEADEERES